MFQLVPYFLAIMLGILFLDINAQSTKNSINKNYNSNFILAKEQDPAYRLVNKKTSLGKYKPDELVIFQGIQVSNRIVPDLKKLLAHAAKDGLTLKVVSGYRSYEMQKMTFNSWVNRELKKNPKLTRIQAEKLVNMYSAIPGHSEHQLGTTVDILSSENNYQFTSDVTLKYVEWLEKHAHLYHFKITYPKTQTEYIYEPWHLRWYPE